MTMSVLNNAHAMNKMFTISGRISAECTKNGSEKGYRLAAPYREVQELLQSRFKELIAEGHAKDLYCRGKEYLDLLKYQEQVASLKQTEFNAALLHVINKYAVVLFEEALQVLGNYRVVTKLLKREISPEEAIRQLILADGANKPICKKIYDFFRLDVYEYE